MSNGKIIQIIGAVIDVEFSEGNTTEQANFTTLSKRAN
jgi:F0F1-type ATP synthase beta subunit